MSDITPKPCPLCHEPPTIENLHLRIWRVQHEVIDDHIVSIIGRTKKEAIQKWNSRCEFPGPKPTYDDLIMLAKWAETLQPNAVEIMRREGFKFTDLEDRWQKLAFSFYSDLSELNSKIRQMFEEES